MAMQTYVFYEKDKQPDLQALAAVIKEKGIDYSFGEEFDLEASEYGFASGKFEGLESGFDFVRDVYNPDDWNWEENDLPILGHPYYIAVFNTYSNAQEIVGMMAVSSVLAEITGGAMFSDFFDDELIRPEKAFEMANDIIENSRDQFNGPSKIRAATA
ncbi:MAG: hypothetical protein P1U67_02555 [Alcanivoracaceae bacterium]|nr:hypothetical protein [Alcanivoracaceae bacterium]